MILGDDFFRFDVSLRVRFRAPPYKWLHGRRKKRFLASAARFGGHGPRPPALSKANYTNAAPQRRRKWNKKGLPRSAALILLHVAWSQFGLKVYQRVYSLLSSCNALLHVSAHLLSVFTFYAFVTVLMYIAGNSSMSIHGLSELPARFRA